jgi:hypothetical protein
MIVLNENGLGARVHEALDHFQRYDFVCCDDVQWYLPRARASVYGIRTAVQ